MKKLAIAVVVALGIALGFAVSLAPPARAQTATQAIPPACGNPTHAVTVVGTTAAVIPAAPLAGRKWIYIRVSPENASAAPIVKCRMDGAAPVIGAAFVGDTLHVGDQVVYGIAGTATIRCVSDTAGTVVTSTECTRAY